MNDRFECEVCGSKGFEPSDTDDGCTFCDGTFGGTEEAMSIRTNRLHRGTKE